VRAVQRAGRIITALAEHPYPMGVGELAAYVMLSPASVHRLLATLIDIGWVDQNSRTAKYRLGTRMFGIGTTGLVTSPVVQNGHLFLTRLAGSTGHNTALSTLVGLRVIHLARAQGRDTGRPDFEPGVSQPAHAMADGKLLLSYLQPEERAYLYQVDGLRRYTPNTIVEPGALEQELACIRAQGYAVDHYERFEQARGLAVPVLGMNEEPLLAMLCIGSLEDDSQHDAWLADQMKSLAREMSDYIATTGDMPRVNTEFAKYNLE
jgi:IclR family acetate operon transcriptional repressor